MPCLTLLCLCACVHVHCNKSVLSLVIYANDCMFRCCRKQSCLNPECNTPMLDHVQHFTQTTGSVKLTLETIEPIHLTNSTSASTPIVMWCYCSACKQMSQARLMSLLTWHLSFMKFIDFLINSPPCLTHNPSINASLCCSAKSLSHCFSLGGVQVTFR